MSKKLTRMLTMKPTKPSQPFAVLTVALILATGLCLLPAAARAQVDLSRYVALGDSLTAGVASGGISATSQRNSYPALIHRQAVGGDFEQPLVSAPGIPPLLEIKSLSPLSIAPRAPLSEQGVPINLTLPRPYDNLGVPGARVGDTLRTSGGGSHDLVLRPSAFGNTTALQQALFLQPTFVTLWIGNNDALAAATSGIVIDGVTLTPLGQFEADFRTIVGAITASGAGLAVATIPDVTSIPFVTTLPSVVLNPATGEPVLINNQPVPIIGPGGQLLGPNDRVLLSASQALAQGIGIPQALGGTGQPLGTQFVLSAGELNTITARIRGYNNVIRTVAQEAGAALVDINAEFGRIAAEGLPIGGIDYSTDFLTGGLFSYDGVHASAFGYAYVASLFIEAINQQLGGDIPQIDLFSFTFEPDPSGTVVTAAEARSAILRQRGVNFLLHRVLSVPPIPRLLELLAEQGGGGAGSGGGGGAGPGAGAGNGGGGATPPQVQIPPPAIPLPPR